jgi:serine/threonine-protein kinase HipA
MTESYKSGSKYTKEDFLIFAVKIGINHIRFKKLYQPFLSKSNLVVDLTQKSFLPDEMKEMYLNSYFERLNRLKV